jgi:hypothetical protein
VIVGKYIKNECRHGKFIRGYLVAMCSSIAIILLCSCGSESPEVSFYYWRTEYNLTQKEESVLNDNDVSTLYIRYFDVDLQDEKPVPIAPIHFTKHPTRNIVPVVYIKNIVLISSIDVPKLARNITELIQKMSEQQGLRYDEIQLDCDWTPGSRYNFFKLIDLCKSYSKKRISSTIRLHQVKYSARTGIPNIHKGVLMYYNMGKIAPDTSNSIYERRIALRYITKLSEYPIELDIALPLFSWGIHIRDDKVIGLINKIKKEQYLKDSNFRKCGSEILEVQNSILKAGRFFKKGDKVKIESVSRKDLERMIDDLTFYVKSTPKHIIFFDLDEYNLEEYSHEPALQTLCNSF